MRVDRTLASVVVAMWVLATMPLGAVAQAEAPNEASEAGDRSDYCDRQLGTWFYCSSALPERRAEAATSSATSPADDFAVAEAFKAEMERARIIAVWNPTEANIRRYYDFQQVTLQKSGLFADTARRLIWSDPSLDYTLTRPVSAAAKSEWLDARRTDRDLFFRGIYDQVGIFYVYRGDCGPCRVASPLVREFGQRFGITVHAISTDGAGNPEFPYFVKDTGQLRAWGFTDPVTPAYMIFQQPSRNSQRQEGPLAVAVSDGKRLSLRRCDNPKGCLNYLGAGVLTVDELADRLYVVLATEPGKDF